MAVAARSDLSAARVREVPDAGRLFEQHSDRLFGYCLRFLRSRAEAEDAVQTTFLYAHRALQRGVVPESEYPWLHSIAKNVCRWQQRTIARRGPLSTEIDLDTLPSRRESETDLRALRMELDDALESIPESQRRALVLREWHGLTSDEVASRLGMTPTATYALLTRARRSFARALTTGGRPVLGLNLGSLVYKLKGLLAGGTAKAVATTVAVGTVAVGGIAVERAAEEKAWPERTPASSLHATVDAARESDEVAPPSVDGAVGVRSVRPTRGETPPPSPTPGGASSGAAAPAESTTPATGLAAPSDTTRPGEAPPRPEAAAPALPVPAVASEPEPLPLLPLPEDLLEPLDLPELELPPISTDGLLPPLLEEDADLGEVLSDPLPALPLPELPLPGLELPLP